jgi:hypothetical protein
MMKKNNMKKKSTARKLLPAAGMLAVSASMLATSTYAWFTMNKEVSVTGMTLQTKVGSNLLICQDNVEANYKSGQIAQSRSALLEPVSTVNAATNTFFYTTDAAANGQKITAASTSNYSQYDESSGTAITGEDKFASDGFTTSGAGKAKVDTAFNTAYGIAANAAAVANNNAYGYVDYNFYLKATNDVSGQELRLTYCNMLKDNAALAETNDAWRIAVFAKDITSGRSNGLVATDITTYDSGTASTYLKTILAPDGATYFTSGMAVSAANAAPSVAVSKLSQNAVLDTFSTTIGETRYYKVTVRVWLEGEDTTCFSSNYSTATASYTLDLGIELGKGTAVNKIGSVAGTFTPAVVTATPVTTVPSA